MTARDYLTTGEAAKLLGISRSTVSRRFDMGLLRGKTNPITGERSISTESLLAFMREHGLSTEAIDLTRRRVLIVASESELRTEVEKILATDSRLTVSTVGFGSDALILCTREVPHVLLLMGDLPDLQCSQVIKSLRRRAEYARIKMLCLARSGERGECEGCEADAFVDGTSLEPASFLETIYRLCGLRHGGPEEEHPVEHRRRWPRYPVNLPARIGVVPKRGPRKCHWGRATVRNVSESGAYLCDLEFEKNVIPAVPFRIILEVNTDPLASLRATCQLIRLQSNGSLCAGVRFLRISRSDRSKIAALAVHA